MDEKILIVEDDAAINRLLSDALTGAGCRPQSAFSGSEASLLLPEGGFDLVILDLMLPGKSGEEVLEEARRDNTVPVIVLSARVDKESKLALLALGEDDYITKPFDVDELLARVKAQLRRVSDYAETGRDDMALSVIPRHFTIARYLRGKSRRRRTAIDAPRVPDSRPDRRKPKARVYTSLNI
ncbi:MAG: response regulator transcription factor [Clostridiales bacterium]|nr:response regulator transcription factor [Clostridiales bacterium]